MVRRMPDWPISWSYGNPEVCSVGLPMPSRLPGGEDVRSAGGESVDEEAPRETSVDGDATLDP
jgi:hypothetical protein